MRLLIMIVGLTLASSSAHALDVFACEPEWAALVAELAGEQADITTATTAFQDPHRLEAKPSLIAAVRQAQLLVCTGAEAADYVRRLEIPVRIDRDQGDIHPQGNPHIHLQPRNIERIAGNLAQRLIELDRSNEAVYAARRDDFLDRWEKATAEWTTRGQQLAGLRLVSHHRSFSYLADWLDLNIVATLEPKPGIPPSSAHLARLLEQLTDNPPVAVIRTPYANEKPSTWLGERLNVAPLELPYTVGGTEAASDLFKLFDVTLSALEEVSR
jgi:zinc/manganese transport system substrate-binding protein